jgi:hypothetical protein
VRFAVPEFMRNQDAGDAGPVGVELLDAVAAQWFLVRCQVDLLDLDAG